MQQIMKKAFAQTSENVFFVSKLRIKSEIYKTSHVLGIKNKSKI